MKSNKSMSIISGLAFLALLSCAKEAGLQGSSNMEEPGISSKLIHSSANAEKGSLLVCFNEGIVRTVEGVSSESGAVSGVTGLDAVLQEIGTYSFERVFPVDPLHEEETRAAGLHRWYTVRFDESADIDAAARKIAAFREVNAVEFMTVLQHERSSKFYVSDSENPVSAKASDLQFNDPMLSKQWHYINTGDKSIYPEIMAGADVNCGEAWRLCGGDPRVVVAVVDDCVQWDHPDLAANMWVNEAEKNGVEGKDDDGNGFVDDVHGYNFASNTVLTISRRVSDRSAPEHGTHVAGTVAAVNNNGIGVSGIAGGTGNNDGVRIMSCQIFHDDKGGSANITARAIKYAADNGACIIQCSFGYESGLLTSDDAYVRESSVEKQAIDYFVSKNNCEALEGGLVIFAAGNDGKSPCGYPGAYKDYIAVTSVACDFSPAYYTNYGSGSNIAAPGGDVYQSDDAQILSTVINGKYGYSQGTSMACPHVSGVAALGLSYALKLGRKFTRDEFNSLILTSVTNIDKYCTGSRRVGNGMVDLSKQKGLMGSGAIDAYRLLMNVRGTTCLPVPVGKQHTLDVVPYLGEEGATCKIIKMSVSNEDMQRLGMSAPTVFGNKVVLKCANAGSAIVNVEILVGTNSGSGMFGKTINKEFALVARESFSDNGGWF